MPSDITERLLSTLQAPYDRGNKPILPDELLYDDNGLRIWNEIIFTPEFYQTHDEIALFKRHGESIARLVSPGVTMVDIGAGLVIPLLAHKVTNPHEIEPCASCLEDNRYRLT